ncbi:hypothetical protein SADUNF_Sadunf18G0021300 [Salix dunnii]|uniref:Plant heme peroxidase family profile domain-containing protein n=1 Tax=Salix dunnii TaxID=1413687 RepID=A0A835J2Y5_9ROSI|nr:hypothetical protein SADUNF_Sadunf18G0021300 [Salix dunnii]
MESFCSFYHSNLIQSPPCTPRSKTKAFSNIIHQRWVLEVPSTPANPPLYSLLVLSKNSNFPPNLNDPIPQWSYFEPHLSNPVLFPSSNNDNGSGNAAASSPILRYRAFHNCHRHGGIGQQGKRPILKEVYHGTLIELVLRFNTSTYILMKEEVRKVVSKGKEPTISMGIQIYPQVASWADVIAVAGAEAVSVCGGGATIPVPLCRLDSQEPDAEGKLPQESLNAASFYTSLAMNTCYTALIMDSKFDCRN